MDFLREKASVTAGFRCAPDTGPRMVIKTTNMAPVASELQSSAMRDVTASKTLGHDAGAHDGREEESRAKRLGDQATGKHHCDQAVSASVVTLPMSSRCFWSDSLLSLSRGKLTKMPMRLVSMRSVSAKAKLRSASVPSAFAGSGSPQ